MKKVFLAMAVLFLAACGEVKCDDSGVTDALGKLVDGQVEFILALEGIEDTSFLRQSKKDYGTFTTMSREGNTLNCKCSMQYSHMDKNEHLFLDYKVVVADDGEQFLLTLVNME